jgi:hypothetical protein
MLSLLALALIAAAPDAPPDETHLEVTPTGYLDDRYTVAHVNGSGLLPTSNQPTLLDTAEANLQLRLRYGQHLTFYTDTSLLWQNASLFFGKDAQGNTVRLPEHDVPTYRPQAVISELYVAGQPIDHLDLLVGKKRIVWGAGFAENPTDLLNPPKDPTDPTFQRSGAWLARVEAPFDRFTLTGVAAGQVLREYAGMPTALVHYPSYPTAEAAAGQVADDRDHEPHFALAARAYLLINDTDVNLVYTFTNAFRDVFLHKSRAGLSLSHAFGGWEVHFEALLQQGSARLYADPGCASSAAAFAGCFLHGTAPVSYSQSDALDLRAKALLGARYSFEDNSLFSIEYYFNGEGYTPGEYTDYLHAIASGESFAQRAPQFASQLAALEPGASPTADPGTPQKFTFDPLRRHYLFVTYTKAQIHNDFTLGASAIVGLEDLSGELGPTATWSVRDWLTLTLIVYAPVPGVKSLGAEVNGTRYAEFNLQPADWQGLLSFRAFF